MARIRSKSFAFIKGSYYKIQAVLFTRTPSITNKMQIFQDLRQHNTKSFFFIQPFEMKRLSKLHKKYFLDWPEYVLKVLRLSKVVIIKFKQSFLPEHHQSPTKFTSSKTFVNTTQSHFSSFNHLNWKQPHHAF